MEGNIYNKISQEINFKLPDINFDSDSDSNDTDKPIKPYIRPAADILFGWGDSENEEFLDILSKMPSDQSNDGKRDITCNIGTTTSNDLPICGTEKLPFMNITLSNGIKTHTPLEIDDNESRLVLPRFGVRDNFDLDKVLDEMDMSNYETTFFDDALSNINVTVGDDKCGLESASGLLTRLDEMAKKYAESCHNMNNCQMENIKRHSTGMSLSNMFNQLNHESSKDTVTLDLRVENSLWSTRLNQETTMAFVNHVTDLSKDEESSDDNDDYDTTHTNCSQHKNLLWIDHYRKSKTASGNNGLSADRNNGSEIVSLRPNVSCKDNEETVKKSQIDVPQKDTSAKTIPVATANQEEPVSKEILMKIEKIKQREKRLSERRTVNFRLNELLPVSEDSPLLVHEEISFDPSTMALIPNINFEDGNNTQYFSATVLLSAPNIVMTMSKIPSPITENYQNENFAATLSVLLQLTKLAPTNCPFTVLGLQQIFYENQLQLVLLCQMELSLTKLKSELKKYSVKELLLNDGQLIADLPLSNILRILPYNAVINGNIWCWENSSINWQKLVYDTSRLDDRNGCKPINISTSCVILEEEFYLATDFYQLVMRLLERCTFSGLRLIYNCDGKKQLVLAIRGFDAVNSIKLLQNSSQLYRAQIKCTRFQDNSLKELAKYFGPRLNELKLTKMFESDRDHEAANELSDGFSIYHSLYFNKPSDIFVLVSPMCLDVGWIINTLLTTGGYMLVNMSRVELTMSAARQLGINEQLVDNFVSTNGVCHLIIVRNENPMHSIESTLLKCNDVLNSNDDNMPNLDQIFYTAPYSNSLLNLLDLQKMCQTPSIRELTMNIPDSPFDDCEQCSFVLLISDELTRHLGQLLDQMANLDLLAVKCMTWWPTDGHLTLVQSQFGLRLPTVVSVDHLTADQSEARMRIGVIVVRSMFLMKELEKIQSTIRIERNLIFAFTMNVATTFGMVGSFFTSSELISDCRRRSSLKFLPADIVSKLTTISILAQFPFIYAPIKAALSFKIHESNSVTTKFRQLWFLLTREGFSVTEVLLDEMANLLFVVKRPNAIFYLTQWAKSHFNDDINLKIATSTEAIEELCYQIHGATKMVSFKSPNDSQSESNVAFIMLNVSLLDSSPEMLTTVKVFWSFLDENDYNCIGLRLRSVDGSDIFKLNDLSLLNLSGSQLRKDSCYLCLLVTGNIVSIVIRDLLESKINLLKSDSSLREEIFLCCDNNQITQCCDIILKPVILDHCDVDINFNYK